MEDQNNPSTQVPPVTGASSVVPPQPNTIQNPAVQNPNPQPQPVDQAPLVDQAPPPEKKRISKTVLILIVVVVVGLVGVFVFKNASSPAKNTKQSSDNAQPISTGKKPKQAGLTTYTNSDNKFSIQYPEELKVKENAVGMGVSTVELRSEDNLDEDYLADIQMMTIPKYLAKAVGQDFDEYYNMSDNTSKTITAQEQSRVITKVKNRTISNQRAFEFKSTDGSPNSEDVTIGVYIEIGDNILIISTLEENREDLEEMLANFTYNP